MDRARKANKEALCKRNTNDYIEGREFRSVLVCATRYLETEGHIRFFSCTAYSRMNRQASPGYRFIVHRREHFHYTSSSATDFTNRVGSSGLTHSAFALYFC
jgi:hypothetical protein